MAVIATDVEAERWCVVGCDGSSVMLLRARAKD
jgi:hypothetical protein